MRSAILACLFIAGSALAEFPHAEIDAAITHAAAVANEKGYAAFLDETFASGDDIMVQSEEFFPVFYGRAKVTPYYKPPAENLYAHRERYSDVEGTQLGPDLAIVTWHNRYDMQAVGRAPVGGWSRMIALMRREQGAWKFQALVQAPMSLISQARRIQEEAVSADFVEYARKQNPDYDRLIAGDKRLQSRRSGLPWLTGGGSSQDGIEGGEPTTAAAPGADRIPCPVVADAKATLVEQVTATLRCGEVVYDRNDSAAYFDQLWSRGPDLVFMSEQFFPVFYGRKPVEAYFKPPLKNLYAYRERYSNIEAMPVGPDLAVITYHVRYDMHAITRTALGGWSRIFAVMKKEGARWRFIAQFEAPMSLVSQARWTHEAALAADFPGFAHRQNPRYDEQVAKDKRIEARKGTGVPWVSAGENIQPGYKPKQ